VSNPVTGEVEEFVGFDVGKSEHYAQAVGPDGGLFDQVVANDEAASKRSSPPRRSTVG
jgi:hypothetical protein